jgi:peptidoglycan/xylan/chitin deacetylase (PgdA/CDA1 family)
MMNARYLISNILECSGVNAIALARRRNSVTVLCYHRVIDAGDPARAWAHPGLATSTHVFERQMELLASWFDPISLSETVRWLDWGGEIPRRAVLVTFDDGWIDTYTNAFPIMKRLGIPGVVFLATGLIGTQERQWADAVYESITARAGSKTASREVERLKTMHSHSLRFAGSAAIGRQSGVKPPHSKIAPSRGNGRAWVRVRLPHAHTSHSATRVRTGHRRRASPFG